MTVYVGNTQVEFISTIKSVTLSCRYGFSIVKYQMKSELKIM